MIPIGFTPEELEFEHIGKHCFQSCTFGSYVIILMLVMILKVVLRPSMGTTVRIKVKQVMGYSQKLFCPNFPLLVTVNASKLPN